MKMGDFKDIYKSLVSRQAFSNSDENLLTSIFRVLY